MNDMSDMRSEVATVRGLNIHYYVGGAGEPLLIIHGGGDGARSWMKTTRELCQHYTVYVPDLPGFGRSQPLGDYFDLPDFVSFIDEFSRAVALQRFHLMGHSIGGGIALHYALAFPDRVKRLVLVSSFCLGREAALWVRLLSSPLMARYAGKAALGMLDGVKWLARLVCKTFEFANPLTRVRVDMGRRIANLKGQTMVLLHRLSELTAPTLLVWGARDPIVPARHAYAAARVIPDCRVRVFRECGHSVYRDRVDEFSRTLRTFLG